MLEITKPGRDSHLQIRLDKNLPSSLIAQGLKDFFQRPLLNLHSRRSVGTPIERAALGLLGQGRHHCDD